MEKQSAATAQEEKAEQLNKIMAMDRRNRRRLLSIKHGPRNRPFARIPSGVPTGTTPHFRAWMADLSAKSALQKINTADLAEAATGNLAAAWAVLNVAGFKSVWDVSRASEAELLRVNGFGLKRMEAVEKYLTARNVPLHWTAA